MITTNDVFETEIPSMKFLPSNQQDLIFFDIETTGFSPKTTHVYLIGAMYYENDSWKTIQWFADTLESEPIIIASFFDFIKDYKALVHFNGEGFDMPYLIKKCITYNLPYNFDNIKSIDLFKHIKPIRSLLKLENYKQKSIENFLGISRNDKYSGGELINIYNEYLNSNSNNLELLLLHNKEDIIGMVQLLPILSYLSIINNDYNVSSLSINETTDINGLPAKEAIFTLKLNKVLPKRVSYGNDIFYFTAFDTTLNMRIKIYSGELKYFYPDYKDYYYLPVEDKSIHKSVAFYVDKNYRTKAKAANCYSKKTGMFLPEYDEIVSPYFKIDYYDKVLYFELDDTFKSSQKLQKDYISHIISSMLYNNH